MLNWLEEVDKPQSNESHSNRLYKIKRIDPYPDPSDISDVAQLFAAYPVIIGSDTLTQIPTPNETSIHIITSEIAPHFSDVLGIYDDNEVLKQINVRGLKPASKEMIINKLHDGIYPVVTDLYRTDDLNLATRRRRLRYFAIRQERMDPLHNRETEKLRDFFQNTYFADTGSVFLCPTGWLLEDKLSESIAIRTFNTFASSIILVVDADDNRIVGLDIYA